MSVPAVRASYARRDLVIGMPVLLFAVVLDCAIVPAERKTDGQTWVIESKHKFEVLSGVHGRPNARNSAPPEAIEFSGERFPDLQPIWTFRPLNRLS